MKIQELINKIEEIELQCPDGNDEVESSFFYTLTLQFVNIYIGKNTEFYNSLTNHSKEFTSLSYNKYIAAKSVLKSIKSYLKLNLDFLESESYKIKTDIINDFIMQAIELASSKKYHPAAAAILLGAALEEFLKNLAAHKNIDLTEVKKTIDPITQKLYETNTITKQDLKDITSWAGLRNDATHGNFEEVNDKKRVFNVIEGVNLFMRKYKNE